MKIKKIIAGAAAFAVALGLTVSMPYIAAAEETGTENSSAAVSFEDVEKTVMSGNLTVLSLQENIEMIGEIDYDSLQEDILSAMNQLADAQWILNQAISYGFSSDSYRLDQVNTQWKSLDEQYEAIKDGTTKKKNDESQWLMRNTQKQLVMAAESLYMTQKSLEISRGALLRQASAIDRTKKEMEVRRRNGQVSDLNIAELNNGAVQLESGKATLEMNMEILSLQLKNLLGIDLGTKLILSDPKLPGAADFAAMYVEKDLASAKANSYELYDAKKKLDDAEDALKDAQGKFDYYERPDSSTRRNADHSWNSAKYSYDATVRNFELNFRTLYAKVKDCSQVLEAARSALETEEKAYQADKIRFSYGTISQNALKTSEDDLAAARDKVRSCSFDLASAYRQYEHAVNDGIVSSGSASGGM